MNSNNINNNYDNNSPLIIKPKEEKIFVKTNKKSGKKIELKNLDIIKQIEESGELDEWTQNKLFQIKNSTFKNNVFDYSEKKLVSSVRLIKTSKLGRKLTPMVWEYFKNRANLDINQIIKQYGRENLIINYSIPPKSKDKIVQIVQIVQIVSEELNELNELNEHNNFKDL